MAMQVRVDRTPPGKLTSALVLDGDIKALTRMLVKLALSSLLNSLQHTLPSEPECPATPAFPNFTFLTHSLSGPGKDN